MWFGLLSCKVTSLLYSKRQIRKSPFGSLLEMGCSVENKSKLCRVMPYPLSARALEARNDSNLVISEWLNVGFLEVASAYLVPTLGSA